MSSDSIRGFLGLVFSILIVCGIFYGCGSWYSYLDKKHSKRSSERLPVQYQGFIEDFSKESIQFEIEVMKDPYFFTPTDILLKPNWKLVWSNWHEKRCKKLKNGYDLLNRYIYRLHSVTNPPESALLLNSMILDDFAWKLECEEKKISMLKNLFSIYEANSSKWIVQNGKIVYTDESFRKKIEVMKMKYYSLCDRLQK